MSTSCSFIPLSVFGVGISFKWLLWDSEMDVHILCVEYVAATV